MTEDGQGAAAKLREAAALMRERAREAGGGGSPWLVAERSGCRCCEKVRTANGSGLAFMDDRYSGHVASWHPAVALAVAEWLDCMADVLVWKGVNGAMPPVHVAAAEAVARAYLGERAA